MITSRTRMRTKIKKKSKKDNKELRETGASFSVGQVRQSSVIFRARKSIIRTDLKEIYKRKEKRV